MLTSTRPSMLDSTSHGTKIHPSHISDRRFWIPTLFIMLHTIHLSYQGSDHTEHSVPENPESVTYLFYQCKISFYDNFQVPMTASCAIVKDSFPWHFAKISSYFLILRQFNTYWQRRGSIGYPYQGSILVYREILSRKYQTIFLG